MPSSSRQRQSKKQKPKIKGQEVYVKSIVVAPRFLDPNTNKEIEAAIENMRAVLAARAKEAQVKLWVFGVDFVSYDKKPT